MPPARFNRAGPADQKQQSLSLIEQFTHCEPDLLKSRSTGFAPGALFCRPPFKVDFD
jgi:hypothetical protein